MLGLDRFREGYFSCGRQKLLFVMGLRLHIAVASCWGAQALGASASAVSPHGLGGSRSQALECLCGAQA